MRAVEDNLGHSLQRWGRERAGDPAILCARGTRTIRMCSFDARSRSQLWLLPKVKFGELESPGSTGQSKTNMGAIPERVKQARLEEALD